MSIANTRQVLVISASVLLLIGSFAVVGATPDIDGLFGEDDEDGPPPHAGGPHGDSHEDGPPPHAGNPHGDKDEENEADGLPPHADRDDDE